jgi:excisionase family DNA binding protein
MSRYPIDQVFYDMVRQAVRDEMAQVIAEVRAMVAEGQNPEPKSLSIREAAERHSVSERTIYRLIQRGELASLRVGTRHVIPVAALNAVFEVAS